MNRLFTLLIISAVILGCNPFAPGLSDEGSGHDEITAQRTPRDVLTNFRYAYVYKDSLVYSDILDSAFQFISKNYGTSPPTNINWGRDIDILTTLSEIKITFQLTLDGGREIPTIKGEALFNFIRNPDGIWKITRWEDLSSF
jgi:hypothetical protein